MNQWKGPPPVDGTPAKPSKPFPKWAIPLVVAGGLVAALAVTALDDSLSNGDSGTTLVLLAGAGIALLVFIVAAGVLLAGRLSNKP